MCSQGKLLFKTLKQFICDAGGCSNGCSIIVSYFFTGLVSPSGLVRGTSLSESSAPLYLYLVEAPSDLACRHNCKVSSLGDGVLRASSVVFCPDCEDSLYFAIYC
ncbi:Hypothetical predicted protein [Podarcis lilfordi]|uniref:Uncharacterized protein n=1 Tax=Podarcis lilfordi TaxID=74358 RepID=A0AA35P957_9SAUR|nr:Hypothetical predicted protein [Podarcis lilfordi]